MNIKIRLEVRSPKKFLITSVFPARLNTSLLFNSFNQSFGRASSVSNESQIYAINR
jgi:hypothetical protein